MLIIIKLAASEISVCVDFVNLAAYPGEMAVQSRDLRLQHDAARRGYTELVVSSQRWLKPSSVLIASTPRGMARLSGPGNA